MKKLIVDFFLMISIVIFCSLLIGVNTWFFFNFITNASHYNGAEWEEYLVETIPDFLCAFIACLFVMHSQSLDWKASLRYLGFKSLDSKQILVAFLCLLPILAGFGFAGRIYLGQNIAITLRPYWYVLAFTLVTTTGIFEEVVFRGLVFQYFRKNNSFFASAALSGALWSITHLINVACGAENWSGAMFSVILAFILAFPSAYLFELGGNRIWGWWLVHASFDLQSLVNIGKPNATMGIPELCILGGFALSLILTFPLSRLLLNGHNKKLGAGSVALT